MKKNLPIYAYNSLTVQLLVSCEGKFCSRLFASYIKFWIVEAHQMLIWYSLVNKTRKMMILINCVRGQRHELWPLITGEKSAGAKFQIFCNMFQLPSLIKIWTLIHNILFCSVQTSIWIQKYQLRSLIRGQRSMSATYNIFQKLCILTFPIQIYEIFYDSL